MRGERDRLKKRAATLRVEWKSNVAERDAIERDGKAVVANVDRINRELQRRREYARRASCVRTFQAPDKPEWEGDYSTSPDEPSWDALHLAVGTWS